MDTEKIVLALEERDRWKARELQMERDIWNSPKTERAQKREMLMQIREHVAYYDALARDMKKSVKPSRLSHLLNSLIIH
jgi:hypothetical protein